MSAPWPSVSRRYVNAGSLSTIALALAFAAAFFSKFLVEMGMVAGWLSVLVARRAVGAGEKAPARPAPIGLLVPLALFFLISGLSASLSLAPGHGWRLIAGEALGAGLAFAAAGLTSPAQARFVTAMFLGVGGFAGAWSIYQYVFEFGGVVDPGHRTYGFMRPVDFVWYGDMMVMVFALALGLVLWEARRVRGLGLVSAGMAAVGMLMSLTRASWLASFGLVTVTSIWRRAFIPLIALALFVGTVLVLPGDHGVPGRVRSIFDSTNSSNADHLARYRVGSAVIRDYPLLGTGPGALKVVYPRYAIPPAVTNVHLHSVYLQMLAERGPLGLGAWVVAIVWGIVHALRAASRAGTDNRGLAAGVGLALGVVLIISLFDYLWENLQLRALTLAFLGLAWSPAVTSGTDPDEETGRTVAVE